MEENRRGKFDEIDELLKSTSQENRIKFDSANDVQNPVETDDTIDILMEKHEAFESNDQVPVKEIDVQSTQDKNDAEDEDDAPAVCIIDETSTTVELSESPEFYQNAPIADSAYQQAAVKAPKQKVKFNTLQIVLMCIVGVLLLWCIVFTVDHTVAAQGYSPVFCIETQKYEDGSASYKGLGYKIQFRFDSNDNLTQKCVPIWKDGPNDIADKEQSGASFQ